MFNQEQPIDPPEYKEPREENYEENYADFYEEERKMGE